MRGWFSPASFPYSLVFPLPGRPAFCLLLGCASIVRTPRTTRRWIFRLTTTKN
jgi:hypothetical protein